MTPHRTANNAYRCRRISAYLWPLDNHDNCSASSTTSCLTRCRASHAAVRTADQGAGTAWTAVTSNKPMSTTSRTRRRPYVTLCTGLRDLARRVMLDRPSETWHDQRTKRVSVLGQKAPARTALSAAGPMPRTTSTNLSTPADRCPAVGPAGSKAKPARTIAPAATFQALASTYTRSSRSPATSSRHARR